MKPNISRCHSWIIFQLLILFVSTTTALEDRHELRHGLTIQSCAKLSDYRNSFLFLLGQNIQPKIDITFQYTANTQDPNEKEKLERFKKAQVDVTILPSNVLAKVRVDPKPIYKICDESSLKRKMCTFPTQKELEERLTLNEAIEQKVIKDPILKQKLKLDSIEIGANTDLETVASSVSIEINQSEIYCIIMSLDLKEDDLQQEVIDNTALNVKIGWQQSYGQLLISDYHYLYISGLMSLAYSIASSLYWYYLFVYKFKSDKTNATAFKIYSRARNFQIQIKILTYLIIQSVIYICLMLYYYRLNKLGYVHNDFITALINFTSLGLETFVTIWLVYNVMLFSSGYIILTSNIKSNFKQLNLIKSLTILLLFSFLSFDLQESTLYSVLNAKGESIMGNLIFVQLVIITISCLYWGFNTYKSLKQIQFKSQSQIILINKLFQTILLIFIPFLLSLVLRGIISKDYIDSKFEAISVLVSYSYIFNFLVTLAIACVWKDSSVEQNEIYFK